IFTELSATWACTVETVRIAANAAASLHARDIVFPPVCLPSTRRSAADVGVDASLASCPDRRPSGPAEENVLATREFASRAAPVRVPEWGLACRSRLLQECPTSSQHGSKSMVTVPANALQDFIAEIFAKAGCSAEEGRRIAKYLVAANLTGHDSHGVVRVLRYVQMKFDGRVVADQKIATLIDTPVMAVVDGCFGFGQTVAPQAVELGIEKCRQHGLAVVALRNAGHIGRVGDWAALAAEAALISVHFVNAAGSVLVAPFGGVDRRFSTAPFCVGIPRP